MALVGLIILVGWAMHVLAPVALPVVLAVFISVLVYPLDEALCKRLPDALSWIGRVVVVALMLLVTVIFIGGLAYVVQQIASQVPDLTETFGDMIPSPDRAGPGEESSIGSRILREMRGAFGGDDASIGSRIISGATQVAQSIASAMGSVIAVMVLVFFLVILALSESDLWQRKLDALTRDGGRFDWRAVSARVGVSLRRFIIVRTGVGMLTAISYGIWLNIFGLDMILVWAILTLLMNYIPNLGSLVSGVFPTLYALATKDLWTAFLIGAGIFTIEQTIGNLIAPRLQSRQVALSPLVILIAVLFWGWMWGIAGAFLATPMTLTIMTVCAAIPALRGVALFLSNQSTLDGLGKQLGW
jgi:AI-2 transport protein TqsA